jgi:anthranilate/para-aminobenzoate synthase component I
MAAWSGPWPSWKAGIAATREYAGRHDALASYARLPAELLGDRKELAEHVLSVTTMFAELEPLCAPDSLVIRRLLDVIRQQRVQHLSSVLTGQLAPRRHALGAPWVLFPSVTVIGLPKASALALLCCLEPPRGVYAGALG